MRILISTMIALFSVSSFAYEDGTYSCKNANPDVPNSTYTLSTVNMGGVDIPVLKIVRYRASEDGRGFESTEIKGIPVYSKTGITEYMSLNRIYLQFEGDQLLNCVQ